MGTRIVIMLGGEDMVPAERRRWAMTADVLIGADSGGDRLLEAGLRIDALVGDLDSVSEAARRAAGATVHISEQETTDFEKALFYVETHHLGGEVLILGSEGDRSDHVLATLQSAAKCGMPLALGLRSGLALVATNQSQGPFLVPDRTPVSLLPLTPCRGVSLSGVKWSLTGATLDPVGRQSISNLATGPVELSIEEGIAYLFLGVPAGTWPSDLIA